MMIDESKANFEQNHGKYFNFHTSRSTVSNNRKSFKKPGAGFSDNSNIIHSVLLAGFELLSHF